MPAAADSSAAGFEDRSAFAASLPSGVRFAAVSAEVELDSAVSDSAAVLWSAASDVYPEAAAGYAVPAAADPEFAVV